MFWSTQLDNAFWGYADTQKEPWNRFKWKKEKKKTIGQGHTSTGFRWI